LDTNDELNKLIYACLINLLTFGKIGWMIYICQVMKDSTMNELGNQYVF